MLDHDFLPNSIGSNVKQIPCRRLNFLKKNKQEENKIEA